ncbi:MAG: methyltransferase domain-containing protein [Filomicrobium sp.]
MQNTKGKDQSQGANAQLVKQQFGSSARAYAECEVHRSGASLDRLVELVAPQDDWTALDIATGAGHTAAVFAPHVAKVVASDITEEMLAEALELARERGLKNLSTEVANAEDLPFDDNSFDLVTCRLAAHHFPNPNRFVAETSRVLRKGGTFALVDNIPPTPETTPGLTASEEQAAAKTYNSFEKLRDPSHARALSAAEWQGLCEQNNLTFDSLEVIEKEMAFQPWVERMHCSEDTTEALRSQITTTGTVLNTFLKPRQIDGELHFSLREAILIAKKTG